MKKLMILSLFALSLTLPGLALADDAAVAGAAPETLSGAVPGADLVGALLGSLPVSWGEWVTLVVTVCAALAVVLPAPKANANVVWRGFYWLVQVLALNKGRAANAQDTQPTVIRRVG